MNSVADISRARPSVASVVQAIAVVRHLAEIPDGAGVTAVAASLSISASSCFNILKTLVAEDFLEFDSKTKVYRLGIGAIDLARHSIGVSNVLPAIKSQMQDLSSEYNMAIGLWRLRNRKRLVMVGGVESDQLTRIHLSIGQRVPILAGAIGRCVAANLDLSEEELAAALEESRWQSRPTLKDYMRQVAQAKELGWSIDTGEWLNGLVNVAAPIVNESGIFEYGVTATMLVGQHDHVTVQTICEKMRNLGVYASKRVFGSHLQKKA